MTAEREGGPADEELTAREYHIPVTKTARYWTLGDADGAVADVWFVLHGYKQLARRFLKRFAPIAGASRLIVAPEALSRFYVRSQPGRHGPESVVGATWMTREDREVEIRDYVAYLDRLAETVGVGEGAPTILGFSQGVATATRWAVHGRVRPRRLILWGDVTPNDDPGVLVGKTEGMSCKDDAGSSAAAAPSADR